MATAGSVVDDALDRLQESRTTPIFWSRAELLIFVNEGFLEFTISAGQLTTETTYPLIGAKIQAIPVTAIALIHVSYASEMVEKSTIERFDRANPNWESQYGVLQKWSPCGLDKWIVDRHPTSALSVSLTTLDNPQPLEEDSEIDLAPEYIEALTDYVFHMARFKEGGAEFQQAMPAYDDFQNKTGLRGQKTWSEQYVYWARNPNADTGPNYSTLDRS